MTRYEYVPRDLPSVSPVEIPLDWSAEQALAAYEWLEALRTRIWLLYGSDIEQFLRIDVMPTGQPLGGDDDPPF